MGTTPVPEGIMKAGGFSYNNNPYQGGTTFDPSMGNRGVYEFDELNPQKNKERLQELGIYENLAEAQPPTGTVYPGDSWGNVDDLSAIDNQVAGNYSQNAVAHQLFGGNLNTAFDDLNSFQQGQVMDAIGAYGTTSVGNLG
jgi:hypothetical protein